MNARMRSPRKVPETARCSARLRHHVGQAALDVALRSERGADEKPAEGLQVGDILVATDRGCAGRRGSGRVRVPADKLDERPMAEGGGEVEWLRALLGLGEPALGMGSRLIRAAVKPEGDSALREGRDHGMNAVRAGLKVDRVMLDTLQDLHEGSHGHPEVSAPQLGSAPRQLGTQLVLDRVQLPGNVCQLVDAPPRRRFVGPGELRVPDGMHDLEQLPRIPYFLAERARTRVILPHLRRHVPPRHVEGHTLEQADLELCSIALGSLGRASEEAEGGTPVADRFPVGQAVLGAGDAQPQVLDGPRGVVAPLEMDGEFGGGLGQAVAVRSFEGLADSVVQPPAPRVGHLLVDHLMMQGMGKLVQPGRAPVLGTTGRDQESMRLDHPLRDRLHHFDVATEGPGHHPRRETHAGHAGRLQDGALVRVQVVELNRDHLEKVLGHCEIPAVGDHVDRRASARVGHLAAPDEFLDDGDDEQRVAVGTLVNEGSEAIGRVGEAAFQVLANVRG